MTSSVTPPISPQAPGRDLGLVSIPGGEYLPCIDDAAGFPADGAGPTRLVTLWPFRLARHAATNAQFAAFVAATGRRTVAEREGCSWRQVLRVSLPGCAPGG